MKALLGKSLLGLLCLLHAQWVLASEPVRSQARTLASEPAASGGYLQLLLGLGFIVALIIGMGWFIRRIGSFQAMANGRLKLLGGLSIGQRERILLVQVGETQLLIGTAPGQIRTLHVLDKPLTVSDSQPIRSSGFADKLNMFLGQKN